MLLKRPYPPDELYAVEDVFLPAPDVEKWLRETFILPGSKLQNPDHEHLERAHIGVLWTNATNIRQMRNVAGMAEIPKPPSMLNQWAKARWNCQVRDWFGALPDFLITLSAVYAATSDNASFCALVEHELYHCSFKRDLFGFPKFNRKTNKYVWAILGHDVEEHIGVVRRYGPGAAAGGVRELVAAAQKRPEVATAAISGVCGTCRLKAA